jgi:hypothetical protein
MDAERIAFQDWPIPDRFNRRPRSHFSQTGEEVLREFDVATIWKIASNSASVAWKMLKVAFSAPSMIWMFFIETIYTAERTSSTAAGARKRPALVAEVLISAPKTVR